MEYDRKGRTAITVALIAALGGLATAVVNRVSPNEPTAMLTYEETRRVVNDLQRDVIKLEVRLDAVEDRRGNKKIRRDRKSRKDLPNIDILQRAR